MDGGQVGNQNLGGAFAVGECVTLNGFEQVEHATGGRPSAGAAFGVQRQSFDSFVLHRLAQLAFQEGFQQERKEVDREWDRS